MTDRIGQRFGQYEILSVLGQGGMATVYRARQQTVNREVALKIIKPQADHALEFGVRFAREAQTIAQLSNPHIVKLFDYGREGETLYLIMELLSGGSLHDLLRQGPLPLERIDRLFYQIATALDYAHQQGVIHRDLKPQNVLLDSQGNAYLTDFGIAKGIQQETTVTQTGLALGTPAYMSPEAWLGEAVDFRSDLYAFGVMLYEMLTGQLPFQSDSPAKMLLAHVNHPPPHVSRLPAAFAPQIDAIIQQALAKKPESRPESALAMATALHKALNADESWTPPARGTPKAWPSVRLATELTFRAVRPTARLPLNRLRLAGLALVVALLLIGLVGAISLSGRGTASVSATAPPGPDIAQVEPVATDEYMILVAQPEQLGKQPRNVTRFIVDNLTDALETSLPYSKLRIREYPKVISSPEQARAVAQANGAWVIVWGNVNDEAVDLQVQTGSLAALRHNKISESTIRRFTDVHIRLTDPQRQSFAIPVLMIMDVLQAADGNVFETARLVSLGDQLKTTLTAAEVIGSSGGAQISRAILYYLTDTPNYIAQMQPIIDLDSSSPLPYLYRGMAYFRTQHLDSAMQDAQTAQHLGPDGWEIPLYMFVFKYLVDKDYPGAVQAMDKVVQANPEDWYAYFFRGALYYLSGQIDPAKADMDKSIAFQPNSSAPYTMAAVLAIHQGRIADAKALLSTIRTKFPDASYMAHITDSIFGPPETNKMIAGHFLSISDYLFVSQYDRVLKEVDTTLKLDATQPDLYMAQGFAYCNLSRWADAEKSYTQALALDANYAVLYALRAEVRTRQGNVIGALSDVQALRKMKGSEELTAMIDGATKGGPIPGCQNIFTSMATPAR